MKTRRNKLQKYNSALDVSDQILDQFQSCFVSNQGEVRMQLQDGAGSLRLDGTEEAVLDSLSLACAIMLILFVLSINFIGDGLRDASDPTQIG